MNIHKNKRIRRPQEYFHPENFIKWSEVSRFCCGSRFTMRANKIPDIHEKFIEDLMKSIKDVLKKHTHDLS